MQVQKEERKQKQLVVGVGEVSVVAVNPTRDQLNKLLSFEPTEEQKDIEYVKTDHVYKYKDELGEEQEKETTQITVDFWVKEKKSGNLNKVTFYLVNEDRTNKDGSKHQYCNQFGQCSWSPNEFELPSWFCTKTLTDRYDKDLKTEHPINYRKAKVGEEGLLNFLAAFTDINSFNMNNSLFLEDYVSFWKGKVNELKELVDQFQTQSVMCAYEVKLKETDEGTKEYQVINPKTFAPGRFMRNFNSYFLQQFEGLDTNKKVYPLIQFVKNLKNPENTKNFFVLQPLANYDPDQNVAASNDAIIQEPTSSKY